MDLIAAEEGRKKSLIDNTIATKEWANQMSGKKVGLVRFPRQVAQIDEKCAKLVCDSRAREATNTLAWADSGTATRRIQELVTDLARKERIGRIHETNIGRKEAWNANAADSFEEAEREPRDEVETLKAQVLFSHDRFEKMQESSTLANCKCR